MVHVNISYQMGLLITIHTSNMLFNYRPPRDGQVSPPPPANCIISALQISGLLVADIEVKSGFFSLHSHSIAQTSL